MLDWFDLPRFVVFLLGFLIGARVVKGSALEKIA